MKAKSILFAFAFLSLSACSSYDGVQTEILSPACIKPLVKYHYLTCHPIDFKINGEKFTIPENFETDLASIPRFAWSILAPAHSSLIRAAIIHDWFYSKTCDFTRKQTDLIFYHLLKNDGIDNLTATSMYYAVRFFGKNHYNEDYCDEGFKELD